MARKNKKPERDDSLSGQLAATGVDDAAERLRWMVLTWDLAKTGDAEWYTRVFLTDRHYATFHTQRSKKVFDRTSPRRGKPGSASSRNNPISSLLAEDYTRTKIREGGYAMVCKPLAVDLYRFAGRLADTYQPNSRYLLNAIQNGTDLGIEVLAHVNAVRYDALDTHLDEDWEQNFTHKRSDYLWDGRTPEGRLR